MAALEYLDQASILGRSTVALFLILGLNWAFSALHSYQEWRGEEVPLWRVFGAVVGLWFPNWIGLFFFTITLTLTLWVLGLAGVTGWLPFKGQLPQWAAIAALGGIVGARLSDSVVSHWILYARGYRPNPGIKSTPLYIAEAIFILGAFWKGFWRYPIEARAGVMLGALVFILVLPILTAIRVIVSSARRTPWVRWQPIPAWARD